MRSNRQRNCVGGTRVQPQRPIAALDDNIRIIRFVLNLCDFDLLDLAVQVFDNFFQQIGRLRTADFNFLKSDNDRVDLELTFPDRQIDFVVTVLQNQHTLLRSQADMNTVNRKFVPFVHIRRLRSCLSRSRKSG